MGKYNDYIILQNYKFICIKNWKTLNYYASTETKTWKKEKKKLKLKTRLDILNFITLLSLHCKKIKTSQK